MAEINLPQKPGKRKIHSTRIDLTPMVDLGFLLITFFMITTTLAKAKLMDINMPTYEGPPTEWIDTSTITLIPVKEHQVVYYNGALKSEQQLKKLPLTGIRDILMCKKKEVANLPASFSKQAHMLHVLIKPNADCKYEDLVRLLDELLISDLKIYAITDITAEEKECIRKRF